MSKKLSLTIIGAGVMGGAIAGATLKYHAEWKVAILDTDKKKLDSLKKKYPLIQISTTVENIIENTDIIILAVKPQSFGELSEGLKAYLPKDVLIISIMAGQSVKNIQKLLETKRVIHAMPNLGARFLQSTTVWTGKNLTKNDVAFTKNLFNLIGVEMYVSNEDFVDKATAATASGPGFLAYVVASYIKETISLGFTPKEANMLVLKTLNATNTLLQKGDATPEEIVAQVKSKGGTTEAGLEVLKKSDLQKIFKTTLRAAYARAKKLSK